MEKDNIKAAIPFENNTTNEKSDAALYVTRHVTCHESQAHPQASSQTTPSDQCATLAVEKIPDDLRPITAYVSSAVLASMCGAAATAPASPVPSMGDLPPPLGEPASVQTQPPTAVSADASAGAQSGQEPERPKTTAERKKDYRDRLRQRGLHEVQVLAPVEPGATELVRRIAGAIPVPLASTLSQWVNEAGATSDTSSPEWDQSPDNPGNRLAAVMVDLLLRTAQGHLSLRALQRVVQDPECIEALARQPEGLGPILVSDPRGWRLLTFLRDNPGAAAIAGRIAVRVQRDPAFAPVAKTLIGSAEGDTDLRATADFALRTVPASVLVEVLKDAGRLRPLLKAVLYSKAVPQGVKESLLHAVRLRKDTALRNAVNVALADRHLRQNLLDVVAARGQDGSDPTQRRATAQAGDLGRGRTSVGQKSPGTTSDTRSNGRRPLPNGRMREKPKDTVSRLGRFRDWLRDLRRLPFRRP